MYISSANAFVPQQNSDHQRGDNSITTRPRVCRTRSSGCGIPRDNGGYCRHTVSRVPPLPRKALASPTLRIPHTAPAKRISDQRPGPGRRGPSDGHTRARPHGQTENRSPRYRPRWEPIPFFFSVSYRAVAIVSYPLLAPLFLPVSSSGTFCTSPPPQVV